MKPRVSDLVITKFAQVVIQIMLSKTVLQQTKNNNIFVNHVKIDS